MSNHARNSGFRFRAPVVIALALSGFVGLALSATGPGSQDDVNHYIGAAKCKNCHNSEASGDQYGVWEKAKHSSAWKLLATDAAKEAGAKLGVAEPQKSEHCLKCHVTGYGQPAEMFKKGFEPELGVQCETCHGPGEKHMRARFRAAMMEAEPAEGETPAFVKVPEGEIDAHPDRKVCYGCHNSESPSFKAFCFYERVNKIRHLDPRRPRTAEERAALLVCGCGDTCACVHECAEGCGVPPKE